MAFGGGDVGGGDGDGDGGAGAGDGDGGGGVDGGAGDGDGGGEGDWTVSSALAALPLPASVEEIVLVVSVSVPVAVVVTSIENVQLLAAVSAAPVRAITSEPAEAVTVPLGQEPLKPFGVATSNPAGSVSMNPTPLSELPAFGFAIVNAKDVDPPKEIEEAPTVALIAGGTTTVSFAVAVFPLPPLVELIASDVFVNSPPVVPITLTATVQLELTASEPPVNESEVPPATALTIPPHEFVRPFGVATTSPAGSVSAKATPASATAFAAGLVIANASVLIPLSGIDVGLNAVAIDGGATTVTVAVAVFPVPPSLALTWPVVFVSSPTAVPVTLTTTVQLELAAIVAPVNETEAPPAAAPIVPPHEFVRPLGVETTSPAGNASENPTPVSATVAFALLIVNVSGVLPFSGIALAPNALEIDGGEATVKIAEAVLPVPPFVELTGPDVFVSSPTSVPVTLTTTVQVEPAAIVPPATEIEVAPASGLNVPPHEVASPGATATTSPVGKVSVKATPVSATVFAAGFVIVKVSGVVPPGEIEAAPNTIAIDGGATTVRVAALLATPVPPSFDPGGLVALLMTPALVLVRLTVSEQSEPGGSVPPPKLRKESPGVAFHVPEHVLPMPAGFATWRPEPGVKLSEKLTPVSVVLVFGFVTVIVS